MHYVLGDIHNELSKLEDILMQISIGQDDTLYLLGDIFDRGESGANPAGVYSILSEMPGQCQWIRGNHDQWLAAYIKRYFDYPARKRKKMAPYEYNSFELLRESLTEGDLMNLANLILKQPLQVELEIDGQKYLFAHARTSHPLKQQLPNFYLMGDLDLGQFFIDGIDGYISFCGHTPTDHVVKFEGRYLDEDLKSIWINVKENVYLMDCGAGFKNRKLACMCIETRECYYAG